MGYYDCVTILLDDSRIELNYSEKDQFHPLEIAIKNNHPQIIEILLNNKINFPNKINGAKFKSILKIKKRPQDTSETCKILLNNFNDLVSSFYFLERKLILYNERLMLVFWDYLNLLILNMLK